MKERVLEDLRSQFRPEFLNRLDDIIIFHNLRTKDIKSIIDIQLTNLCKRLEEKKISLKLTDTAKELLVEQGFDPVYGARPLKRAIQKNIQDPLALMLLEGGFSEGDTVLVDADKDRGEIVFKKG
jgi:ATP-dependent Clp protease ATP-binding subunit ClpA